MSVNIVGEVRFCPHCGQPVEQREVSGRARPHCPSCAVTFYADPKLAVAVVVEQAGKIVLQRRTIDPGLGGWTLPSGYVERGEPPAVAAVREVQEEVGLTVRLTRLIGLYADEGDVVVLAVYAGEIVAGDLVCGEESDAVGLFSPDDLPPLAFPHDAAIIAAWRRGQADLGPCYPVDRH